MSGKMKKVKNFRGYLEIWERKWKYQSPSIIQCCWMLIFGIVFDYVSNERASFKHTFDAASKNIHKNTKEKKRTKTGNNMLKQIWKLSINRKREIYEFSRIKRLFRAQDPNCGSTSCVNVLQHHAQALWSLWFRQMVSDVCWNVFVSMFVV